MQIKGIKHLGGDRWEIRVTTKHPLNGKMVEKRKLIKGKIEDALKAKERLKKDLVNKTSSSDTRCKENITYAEYLERWLEWHQKIKKTRESTINHYREQFRYIVPHIGKVKIKDMDRLTIQYWEEQFAETRKQVGKRKGDHLKHNSVLAAYKIIRLSCASMRYVTTLEFNPCADHILQLKGEAGEKRIPLSADELARVLSWIDQNANPNDRAFIYTIALTGMRFGEVVPLTWDDIDFTNSYINVDKAFYSGRVGKTKTGKDRKVHMVPLLKNILQSYQPADWKGDDVVMRKPNATQSQYRCAGSIYATLTRCNEDLQLGKPLTAHIFRHTLNNLLRQGGADWLVIQNVVGHSNDRMTAHYSKVDMLEQQKAMKVLDGLALSSTNPY